MIRGGIKVPASMAVIEKTIVTRHASIRLSETSGKALPILLLHGTGASRKVFDKQMSGPLADVHRMVAIDLPGHGQSSDAYDPTTSYTIRGLAAAVGDVLDKLEVTRALIYGWSLGGHIGIELMKSHPAVAGMMLTGTPPVSPGPLGVLRGFHANWDLLLASKRNYTARDAERFLYLCFGETAVPAFLDAILRADGRLRVNVSKSMMRGDGLDQRRAVENATIPIALVNGGDDPFIRLNYLSGLSFPCLWDHRSYVIEGAGHAPFWQTPDVFNPLFYRFVRTVLAREFDAEREDRIEPGAA
jgi:pimeloyl-ACP methyl ester carboxylesterase